jgi:hypothetical protein
VAVVDIEPFPATLKAIRTTTVPQKVLIMRSEIVLAALHTKNRNRFELCHQIFKVVRKLHKPGNRIQDTATDALQRLEGAKQPKSSIAPENANDGTAIEVRPEQSAIAS